MPITERRKRACSALAFSGGALLLSACGVGSVGGPEDQWPLAGSGDQLTPLSSSFGPRIKPSTSKTYEFHRGIDIPAPKGSEVLAAAPGIVRIAGNDSTTADRTVQIEHRRPGSSGNCSDGSCYYTRYIHLSKVLVSVGQHVDQGETVGTSGVGENGFPHLHFEVRDGGDEQKNCVHPLRTLPTPASTPFDVSIGTIDDTTPGQVSVDVTVTTPGSHPSIVSADITLVDRSTGNLIDHKVFDYDAWNEEHTPEGKPNLINNPYLGGIHVKPAPFHDGDPFYSVRFRFTELVAPGDMADLEVIAGASNTHGKVVTATNR